MHDFEGVLQEYVVNSLRCPVTPTRPLAAGRTPSAQAALNVAHQWLSACDTMTLVESAAAARMHPTQAHQGERI